MTTRDLDVLSYGEALIDFLPTRAGVRLREVETFRRVSGGAPANAAIGMARLGCAVGMVTKLGEDEFGFYLRENLASEGIDISGVTMTREAKTGVTFVTLDAEGERSFMFFREPSADYTIRAEDIDEGWMRRSDIFLYGSNLLNERGSRDATLVAIDAARTAGCLLISDPNVRDHLWEDMEEARARMLDSLDGAHIVKVNERELEFFAPSMGLEEAYGEVFAPLGVRALVHTRSAGGAELLFDDLLHVEVEAPPIEKVVDTTGAGDAFIAGLTTGLVRMAAERELLRGGAHGYLSMLDAFDHGDWERVLRLGCLVGTTTCKEYGATPALPDIEEIPWGALGFEPPERRSPASS